MYRQLARYLEDVFSVAVFRVADNELNERRLSRSVAENKGDDVKFKPLLQPAVTGCGTMKRVLLLGFVL